MIVLPTARELVVPAPGEPISVQTAKDHLNIPHNQDNALLKLWIAAARFHAERLSGERFLTQQWRYSYPRFPALAESLILQAKPIQSIDSISYYDSDGVSQVYGTLSGSPLVPEEYEFINDVERPRIALKYNQSWPSSIARTDAGVRVLFTLGYGDNEADVPELYRAGMLLLIGFFYAHREEVVDYQAVRLPINIESLLRSPKVG